LNINAKEISITFPGRIVSYDPVNQTATVKISAECVFSDTFVSEGLEKWEEIDDVPVHTPSGGGWSITMPVTEGDTCLLIFSQVGYDHWMWLDKDEGGTLAGSPTPHLQRSFSQDDGFALVGFNTIPRAIQSLTVSPDNSEWRNIDATQKISLALDGSITIDSLESVTIKAPTVTIDGDLIITGATTGTGLGTFATVGVSTHTHSSGSPPNGGT